VLFFPRWETRFRENGAINKKMHLTVKEGKDSTT
jgi:hypothetical protein